MYDQATVPNKNHKYYSNINEQTRMGKRPGRKKTFGGIVIVPEGIRYFGGYCLACDNPVYLTSEQLAQLKVYHSKKRQRLRGWLIRRLQG